MNYTIPLGTSEPQDFQLKDEGEPIVGTGITIALSIAKKVSGGVEAVVSPPTVAWLDREAGTVRVTGVEILDLGSYLVRFRLTDASSNVGYAPNGERADVWHVVAIASY